MCEWEKDENKKKMEGPVVRQWFIDNKFYEDYRATLKDGERFSMTSAMAFVNSNKEIKDKFDSEFAIAMDRDSLIKYIEENELEDELNKRVEEKWEEFEDSLSSGRKGKYAKFYATQPKSTDEDVII